jgi:hypothetical protein
MRVNIGPYRNGIKDKRPRLESVRIDSYDIWNADHTLSLIIHPLLVKIREHKQGVPMVEDGDLPIEIVSKYPYDINGSIDDMIIRWEYVLDEMIWTFDMISNKDDTIGYNDKGALDMELHNKTWERINNGTRLFGKYFSALWT